jgi:hypothetical protein
MLAEDIAMVAEKIEDPVICQKIEQYAMAPFEVQEVYRKDAGKLCEARGGRWLMSSCRRCGSARYHFALSPGSYAISSATAAVLQGF